MSALKEFADFITLNMANLAATYAQLLAESNAGYDVFPADSRVNSARKILKAVIKAYESQTPDPLVGLFGAPTDENFHRWAEHIDPPQPLAEVECLGQTLTPVVTNLEAGKFLWDLLLELRTTVYQSAQSKPASPAMSAIHEKVSEMALPHEPEGKSRPISLPEDDTHFHKIFDHSNDAIFVVDLAWDDILEANSKACHLLGYAKEELLTMSFSAIYPHEIPQLTAFTQSVLEQGHGLTRELSCMTKSGYTLLTEISASIVAIDDRPCLIALMRDITERKLLGEALHESTADISGILENIPEAIIAIDEMNRIVFFNQRAEHIFGYTSEEVTGQSLNLLLPERAIAAHRNHVTEFLHSQATTRWMGERPEIAGRRKNGDVFPTEASISKFELGDRTILTAILRDVSKPQQTQTMLSESEQRYKELVEDLPVGIYRNTPGPEGHFLEANPAIVAMFEADTTEEFLKHNVSDLYQDPKDRERFSEKMLKVGYLKNEELRLKTLKGREIWGAVTVVMKKDANGQTYFDGAIIDITELKRAEEVLQESEERYRLLLDSSPDPIVTYDNIGQAIYINSAFTQTFGWTEDEVLGKRVDFVPEESWPETRAAIEQLATEGKILGFETKRLTKDRRVLDVQQSGAIIKDKDGNSAGSIIFIRDITERKHIEEALRESGEKYRTILEDIEDGFYEVDIAGNLTFFNDALCKIWGYSAQELMGTNNRQYTDKENAKKLYQTFNRVYRTGEPARGFDWELTRKDGARRTIETSVSLIKDVEGQPIGFRGIARDITEYRRAETELKQRAHHEQTIREVTEKMRAAFTLDELIQTAAEELGERLSAGHAVVQLGIDEPVEHSMPKDNGRE